MTSLLGTLRITAWIEGVTYLLLALTMPLKYGMDIAGPNYVVGMLHGVFFMLYVSLVLILAVRDKWQMKTTLISLAASLIPFGTFWVEKKYFRYDMPLKNS